MEEKRERVRSMGEVGKGHWEEGSSQRLQHPEDVWLPQLLRVGL
jgi:hypothetical protein